MKSMIALTLLGLLALAYADSSSSSEHGYHYDGHNHGHGYDGAVNYYPDNYRNGHRQLKVNHIADYVQAGTGTADWEGVPGTPLSRHGHGHGHGYHGNHGNHGYDKY